jgi:hypothetical protein
MDFIGLLNDITGNNLLAWKVVVASAVFALAGLQVAMAARFWGVGGLPIPPDTAAAVHRWSGRVLLVGAVLVGFACLVGPAGVTSPTRALLHSLFGAAIFFVLVIKFVLLKLTSSGQRYIPVAGMLLFLSFLGAWATSVADYVSAR